MRHLPFLLSYLVFLSACDKAQPGANDKTKTAEVPATSSASPSAAASPPAPKGDDGAALASPFEGEMDMTMRMAALPGGMKVTYVVKADKARLDVDMAGMPAMWVLVDTKEKKSWAVLDAQKMVMVTDTTKPAPGAKMIDWKATRVGKTDVVAGQRCEIWTLEGEKDLTKGQPAQRYEVCVVKKATTFGWLELASAQSNTHFAWAPELEKEGAIPLRTVGWDEAGKESVRVEVTRFERKAVDDARLQLPKGYRSVAAPAGLHAR